MRLERAVAVAIEDVDRVLTAAVADHQVGFEITVEVRHRDAGGVVAIRGMAHRITKRAGPCRQEDQDVIAVIVG